MEAFRELGRSSASVPHPKQPMDEWLIERYIAFNSADGIRRFFRVWHPPWPQVPANASLGEKSLLILNWPWFKEARMAGANFPRRFRCSLNGKALYDSRTLSRFSGPPHLNRPASHRRWLAMSILLTGLRLFQILYDILWSVQMPSFQRRESPLSPAQAIRPRSTNGADWRWYLF